MTMDRKPFRVRCRTCQHTWTPFSTPFVLREAAKILRDIRCPACDANASKIFALMEAEAGPLKPQNTTTAAGRKTAP